MRINIAERLRPFSHVPGTACLVPKSATIVQIFPALLRFLEKEIALPVVGPVKDFTVELDLEKALIRVFGHTANGYMRYLIFKEDKRIVVKFEKFPHKMDSIFIDDKEMIGPDVQERLSLGSHRGQDWQLVQRRQDLTDIFPIWLRLSQMLPPAEVTSYLLNCAEESKKDRREIIPAFLNLFNAHFYGILAPRLFDDQYQGLIPNKEKLTMLPTDLLKQSGNLIRSLFIDEQKNEIFILPHLPPQFHSGRFVDVELTNGDHLSFEWSKKLLRRLIWIPQSDRIVKLTLQKSITSFRMRRSLKEKGKMVSSDEAISLISGQKLYLDRFQK